MGTTNEKFSREWIFNQVVRMDHAVNVYFNPDSNEFKKYGNYITISDVEDPNHELLTALAESRNTYGEIKCTAISNNNGESDPYPVTINTTSVYNTEKR